MPNAPPCVPSVSMPNSKLFPINTVLAGTFAITDKTPLASTLKLYFAPLTDPMVDDGATCVLAELIPAKTFVIILGKLGS